MAGFYCQRWLYIYREEIRVGKYIGLTVFEQQWNWKDTQNVLEMKGQASLRLTFPWNLVGNIMLESFQCSLFYQWKYFKTVQTTGTTL